MVQMPKRCIGEIGFEATKANPCVYLNGSGTILLIFVDDILILAKDKDYVKQVVTMLKQHFTLKELEEVTNYLGVQMEQTECG